jgi:hypothetical protein
MPSRDVRGVLYEAIIQKCAFSGILVNCRPYQLSRLHDFYKITRR